MRSYPCVCKPVVVQISDNHVNFTTQPDASRVYISTLLLARAKKYNSNRISAMETM